MFERTQRRSIFDAFWSRNISSISSAHVLDVDEDDKSASARHEPKRSLRLEPSYLGMYNFSQTTPASSSANRGDSSDNLTRPKPILRRRHSLQYATDNKVLSKIRLAHDESLPHLDDTSDESRASTESDLSVTRQIRSVHFDPTITVREVLQDGNWNAKEESRSKWYSESELRSFLRETINLCNSSARHSMRTYSLPTLTRAIAAARKAGVDDPVMTHRHASNEYSSLSSNPILSAADDDIVVHDHSNDFFMVIENEIKNILIVDNSITSLNRFKRHALSMFPTSEVTCVQTGEDALKLFKEMKDYDLVIVEVEEYLRASSPSSSMLQCSDYQDTSKLMSGSNLLTAIDSVESKDPDNRVSLKIGVSVNLAENCEAMHHGGADLFWCKPPPNQSTMLRNQILNLLLSKRGQNIFICGC